MFFCELKDRIQHITLFLSLFFNIVLITLAILKSPAKMGSYKYLIIYFCTFSIVVSFLEAVVNPFMVSVGTVYALTMNLSKSIVKNRTIAQILVHMTCGCYGFIISLIAIHFIFRYFAIQREGRLKYFCRKYLPFWFLIPILYGATWATTTFVFLEPNDRITKILGNFLIVDCYSNIDQMVYTGGDYFSDDNALEFNTDVFPGMSILAAIIVTSLAIVIWCGFKTSIRIDTLEVEGRSEHTRKLQKQLFKALVLQSCIPLFLLYIPVSIFLFCPIFELQIDIIGHIVTIACAIYPVIDPLPTILVVDSYRFALTECVGCKKRANVLRDQYNIEIS